MTRVVIFGANSAIAVACARLWARRGAHFCLVGRRGDALETVAADLRVRGAASVVTQVADLAQLDGLPALVERVRADLDGVDIALIAQGALTDEVRAERDFEYLREQLNLNAVAPMILMQSLASVMSEQGRGTLAVISSVAGDRGRALNGAYGSAKSAITSFASALRQRLSANGVNVLTIKPGSVDTPMTAQRPKGLLWSDTTTVARDIVSAVDRRASVLYTPRYWRLVMLLVRLIPERYFVNLRF
jgi:short-subunit dehydrogenase